MFESIIFRILFLIWFCGFWSGFGLFLWKYCDYALHKNYYMSSERNKDLYEYDHSVQMFVRNFLIYCCCSWYGVYTFIAKED